MKICGLILLVGLLVGCQNQRDMENQQKQMIEHYVQSYNNMDVDGMVQHFSNEVVFENISNGEVDMKLEGIDQFREQAESAKQYFTERKQTIQSWEFDDQKVVIDISYEAILAIDLPNGMKAGDTLKLKGQSEFLFKDQKIIYIKDKS